MFSDWLLSEIGADSILEARRSLCFRSDATVSYKLRGRGILMFWKVTGSVTEAIKYFLESLNEEERGFPALRSSSYYVDKNSILEGERAFKN